MKLKKYFDIRNVDGVTSEQIKEYKKLCRRERYLEELDNKNLNIHFGYEEEIEFLLPDITAAKDTQREEDAELYKKLAEAMEELKEKNKSWYEAVVAYFYSDEKMSYNTLSERLGICKQTAYLRVKNGIDFLRKILIGK